MPPQNTSTITRVWNYITFARNVLFLVNLARFLLRIRRIGPLRAFLPIIKPLIDIKLKKTIATIEKDVIAGEVRPTRLPEKGWMWEDVRKEVRRLTALSKYVDEEDDDDKVVVGKGGGVDVGQPLYTGKISGTLYFACPKDFQTHVLGYTMDKFLWSNPLHPDIFPGLRNMEASIIGMTSSLFSAPLPDCGNVTSGGTESIILACKVYRDVWYHRLSQYGSDPMEAFSERPKLADMIRSPNYTCQINSSVPPPEILAPKSVHCAFDKAAQYLNIRMRHVPLDPLTGKVDVHALQSCINEYTCMIVASAPNFPHGIVDDILRVGEIAMEYQIPLHLDACLGSFVLPFSSFPEASFSTPAVTSISIDTHKYGYCPKGTSVILYRWNELRRFQYFRILTWPGGLYASPSMSGSRAGSLVAGTWCTMVSIGLEGYRRNARLLLDGAQKVANGLRQIRHIKVLGDPRMTVVAFSCTAPLNIYVINDILSKSHGWFLNALQTPSALHFCITMNSVQHVQTFLEDVNSVVDRLLAMDEEKRCALARAGGAAMYGTAASIPEDSGLLDEVLTGFLDATTKVKGVA